MYAKRLKIHMDMHLHIHILVNIHIHMHTCIHAYIHTYIRRHHVRCMQECVYIIHIYIFLNAQTQRLCFVEQILDDAGVSLGKCRRCPEKLRRRKRLQAFPRPYQPNFGALIIRIGFGAPLYYNYNKEPPK